MPLLLPQLPPPLLLLARGQIEEPLPTHQEQLLLTPQLPEKPLTMAVPLSMM